MLAPSETGPSKGHASGHDGMLKGGGTRGYRWSPQIEALAIATYAESGSLKTASRESGVPEPTIWTWINSEDGIALLESLRTAIRVQYATKLVSLVGLALDQVHKRLTYGDPYIDKHGAVCYAPCKLRDVTLTASIMIDKHALITGSLVGQKANATLNGLADKLLTLMGKGGPAKPEVSLEDSDDPIIG